MLRKTDNAIRSYMYIAGPISGRCMDEVERQFADAEPMVRGHGFHPVNPLKITPTKHDGDCPKGRIGLWGHNEGCHLKADLECLLESHAILLLPGWQTSWGARLELQVATAVGLEVWHLVEAWNGESYVMRMLAA